MFENHQATNKSKGSYSTVSFCTKLGPVACGNGWGLIFAGNDVSVGSRLQPKILFLVKFPLCYI